MAKRNITVIVFFTLFSFVMLLSGSLIIDLYNRSPSIQSSAQFHWVIGLVSIFAGCTSTLLSILFIAFPTKAEAVKNVLK